VLNLNVPNVPLTELQGVRSAPLAPFGTVRTAVTATGDRHLQLEFRETEWEIPPDTDTALVRAGYATVTALGGLVVADAGDAPDKLERALTKVSRRG
jgi:5'-nucleotidase